MKLHAPGIAILALIALLAVPVGHHIAAAQDKSPVAIEQPPASDFTTKITNPFFPLSLVGPKVLAGTETHPDTNETIEKRLESRLLDHTATYDGVAVAIWEERAYEDGQLVEVALDYFAQDSAGNVWYFGEHVDNYEEGIVVNNDGQWFAGEGDNKAGVLLPANPRVGETYQQELAPGIAEDRIDIVSVSDTVTTPDGTYSNCVQTRDYTPLEPDLEEFKWHCPGVGLAREVGPGSEILLQSVESLPAAQASPAPPTTAAPTRSAPVSAPNTGTGDTYTSQRRSTLIAMITIAGAIAAGAAVVVYRRTNH